MKHIFLGLINLICCSGIMQNVVQECRSSNHPAHRITSVNFPNGCLEVMLFCA